MTGPEHFQEAERLLAFSDERLNSAPPPASLAAAQVHATLALAAATAVFVTHGTDLLEYDSPEGKEWRRVVRPA